MDHDRPTSTLVEFVNSVRSNDLSDAAKSAVVQHHFDAIACALAGFSTGPSQIVRNIARATSSASGCSVFGVEAKVAPEQAVFANSTMVRQLEFNDVADGAAGHPSDLIPAIYAAAELAGATGTDVMRGIFIGYDVFDGLAATYPLYAAGFDTTVLIGVAAAMGSGSVLGLNVEELSNAVALALVPSLSLFCARLGVLSNWKGSAAGHAAMTGLFATRLAREGLTGPRAPFEGEGGLHAQVPPGNDLTFPSVRTGRSAIESCAIRYQPVCGATSSIVEPLAAIRGKFDPKDVAKISIETHELAWKTIGGGTGGIEEKRRPQTREDADHSFPYIVVMTLLDGEITAESYSPTRLADPAVHALLDVTSVSPRADFTSFDPIGSEVKIELRNGDVISVTSIIPTGHPRNPMSDEQLSNKFRRASAGLLSDEASSRLEKALWSLENLTDLDELSQCYRAI
jgi:2-methylcitrate dehydratase